MGSFGLLRAQAVKVHLVGSVLTVIKRFHYTRVETQVENNVLLAATLSMWKQSAYLFIREKIYLETFKARGDVLYHIHIQIIKEIAQCGSSRCCAFQLTEMYAQLKYTCTVYKKMCLH